MIMNPRIVILDEPIAVVQVFTNSVQIVKSRWRDRAWRHLVQWNRVIRSTTGWVEEDRLIVNESILDREMDLRATDALLLIDANHDTYSSPSPTGVKDGRPGWEGIRPLVSVDHESSAQAASRIYHLSRWSGISIRYSGYEVLRTAGGLELYIDRSGGAFGAPRRGRYKVADLHRGAPVRAVTNGRGHWVDAHREEQVYRHCDDLFLHLGEFDRLEVRPWSEISIDKPVPLQGVKIVNLEADLY